MRIYVHGGIIKAPSKPDETLLVGAGSVSPWETKSLMVLMLSATAS